ncbi:MAG: KEOPS complex subunit Pcc1 [Nitrososphaeraceae archaeon]
MKNFKAKINITFQLPDKKTDHFTKSIFVSLKPDINILEIPPTKVSSTYYYNNLYFTIDTNNCDLATFRSILNSYLRLVQTVSYCLIDSFDI